MNRQKLFNLNFHLCFNILWREVYYDLKTVFASFVKKKYFSNNTICIYYFKSSDMKSLKWHHNEAESNIWDSKLYLQMANITVDFKSALAYISIYSSYVFICKETQMYATRSRDIIMTP